MFIAETFFSASSRDDKHITNAFYKNNNLFCHLFFNLPSLPLLIWCMETQEDLFFFFHPPKKKNISLHSFGRKSPFWVFFFFCCRSPNFGPQTRRQTVSYNKVESRPISEGKLPWRGKHAALWCWAKWLQKKKQKKQNASMHTTHWRGAGGIHKAVFPPWYSTLNSNAGRVWHKSQRWAPMTAKPIAWTSAPSS